MITLPSGSNRDEIIKLLNNSSEVLNIEKNQRGIFRDRTPRDQHFSRQWALKNDGTTLQGSGTPGADIKSYLAWDITTGGSTVKLGIVDCGVMNNHEDLNGKVSGDATTSGWHGTHVAGIAAAYGDNQVSGSYIGIAGVDWNARIIAQDVGYNPGIPQFVSAINDAVALGIRVLNCSWGFIEYSPELYNAIWAAYQAGASIVVANPETGGEGEYPNIFGSWIINVGASTNTDGKAGYSFERSYTDVGAPGGSGDGYELKDIISTVTYSTSLGQYDYSPGTSMAAPHITGTIGLMLAKKSTLRTIDIEQILKRTAKDYPSFTQGLGYGRINAYEAVRHVSPPYTVTYGTSGWTKIADNRYMSFTGPPNPSLAAGVYYADLYEMRAQSSYAAYHETPWAWLDVPAKGYSAANPNSAQSWQYESISTTAMDLKTYFYWIRTNGIGQTINQWAPYNPTVHPYYNQYTIVGRRDITITSSVLNGWNMTSIPDVVYNFSKTVVYPTSTSDAKRYDPILDTYISTDPLKNGEGYFIKFGSAQNITYTGAPFYVMPMAVIGGGTGWNLFGSVSEFVPVSSVVQTPPNIVASDYFKYGPSGYYVTNTLDPGFGHWVQVNSNGTLTLKSSSAKIMVVSNLFTALDKFSVKDANGFGQEMYVRNGSLYLAKVEGNIEMPPSPPDEIFSARFKTNNYVQTIDPGSDATELPIVVKSAVYPLTLAWEVKEQNNIKYSLVYDGKEISLRGTNNLTINNLTGQALLLKATAGVVLVPQTYALNQNYPNPFNPQTRIDYSLPETKHVKLVIYDLLGREVVKLVDEVQDAGYKSVSFDANNLPSGVYLYRITAGKFNDVKKMILTK